MAGFEEILARRPGLLQVTEVDTGYNPFATPQNLADTKLLDLQKKREDKYNLFNPEAQSALLDFASSVDQNALDIANQRRQQAIDYMAQQGITRPDYVRKGLVAQGLESPMYADEVDMSQVAMEGRQGLMDNKQTQSILPSMNNMKRFDAGPSHEGVFESIDAAQAGLYNLAGKGAELVGSLIKKVGEVTNTDFLKREGAQIEIEQKQWRDEGRWDTFAGYNGAKVQQIGIDFAESYEKDDVLGMLDAIATPEALVAFSNSLPEMVAMMNPWGLGIVMAANVNKNLNDLGPNATTSEKWISTGLSIVGTALDRLGDKVILGNGDKALTKLISSMPPATKAAIVKTFGGQLAQLGIKVAVTPAKAAFEGGTEYAQTILENKASDLSKMNTNVTTQENREGVEAFGIGTAAGGVIPASQTVVPVLKGAVELKRMGDIRKDANKLADEINKTGFNTEEDRQKYASKVEENIANTDNLVNGLDEQVTTAEGIVNNSELNPLEKVSGLQAVLSNVGDISTDSYNSNVITQFGKDEVNKVIIDLFNDEEFNKLIGSPSILQKVAGSINKIIGQKLDEGVTATSLSNGLNKLPISDRVNTLTSIVSEFYGNNVPAEVQNKLDTLKAELTKQADTKISSSEFNIRFDRLKKSLLHSKNKLVNAQKAINKTKIETTGKSYNALKDLSSKKLDALLKTYDANTLKTIKESANKVLSDEKVSIAERQKASGILGRIALSVRGTKSSRESSSVLKAINSLEQNRKNVKQKYDPKLTVKDKVNSYIYKAKSAIDGFVNIYNAEKAKLEKEDAKNVDMTDVSTSINKSPIITNAKRAIGNYIASIDKDIDKADLPIIQEVALQLRDIGAFTETQYNHIKAKLDDIIDVEIVEGSEVSVKVKNGAKKILKDAEALINDNKDVSRNDIKSKIDKTIDKFINTKLSATEKEVLIDALSSISEKSTEFKDYAKTKLDELLAADKDKPFVDRIKEAFSNGYEATKEALKPENRNKTERDLKAAAKKAANKMSKSEITKDSKKLYEAIKDRIPSIKEKGHDIITKIKETSVDDVYRSVKDFLTLEEDGINLKDGANNTSMNGEVIKGLDNC